MMIQIERTLWSPRVIKKYNRIVRAGDVNMYNLAVADTITNIQLSKLFYNFSSVEEVVYEKNTSDSISRPTGRPCLFLFLFI